MLGLQPVKRVRWEAVGVGVAVALASAFAPSRPIADGLVAVGLAITILGGLLQRRTEGTALLNRDPMTLLKRGDEKDLAQALVIFQIEVARWLEDALPTLRRAGATDGEVSHFTTIITYTPAVPALSEEHAAVKGILATRLHRLQPIIARLESET